jgi:Glycosyltransferase 61
LTNFVDARSLCPPTGDRDIYRLVAFKQMLVAQLGVFEGFRVYREMLGLPDVARLELRPLEGLRDFAVRSASSFSELYPAGEAYTVSQPTTVGLSDGRSVSGQARSFFVARLADVRVFSRSAFFEAAGQAVLDFQGDELERADDRLELDPVIFHSGERAVSMIESGDRECLDLDEAFGSLVGPHDRAFGHWMGEYIPKYVLGVVSGLLPPAPVLIDAGMPDTNRAVLELVLPRGAEIIELPPSASAHVRRLWCAPALMHWPLLERTIAFDHVTFPPRRFAPVAEYLAKRASARDLADTGYPRVYFARPESLRRKLVNRAAIEEIVASRDFKIVYPEDYDFATQLGMVRSARFLLGPEGSAMYLNFFARPGTKVCILNHPFMLALLYYTGLLQVAGVDVTIFTGPALRLNNGEGYPNFGLPQYADYEIDVVAFTRFLDDWLLSGEN